MVETEWMPLKSRFPNIELNEYVIMPNHFHDILEIVGATLIVAQNNTVATVGVSLVDTQNTPMDTENNDAENKKGQPQGHTPTVKSIGDMMDAFKSITTVEYIRGVKTWGWQTFDGKWCQRNYYEHIIRSEQSTATLSPQPN